MDAEMSEVPMPYFSLDEDQGVFYFNFFDVREQDFEEDAELSTVVYSDEYAMVLLSALRELECLTQEMYEHASIELQCLSKSQHISAESRSNMCVQRLVDFALFSLFSDWDTQYHKGSVFVYEGYLDEEREPTVH